MNDRVIGIWLFDRGSSFSLLHTSRSALKPIQPPVQ